MLRHKFKCLLLLLIAFIFSGYYGGVEFDIHKLQSDQQLIKETLWNHHHALCQKDPAQTLSCTLAKQFKTSMQKSTPQIVPIRLPLNKTTYSFKEIKANCSLTIIVPLDKCHPKHCPKPMQEIQNSLSAYLRKCPLSNEVCWPLIHHLTGFNFFKILDELLKLIIKNEISSSLKMLFKMNSMLHLYYHLSYSSWFAKVNQCTFDIIDEIHKHDLKIEQLQDILKYFINTKPTLFPMVVLKNIDKAFCHGKDNQAMEYIVTYLSEATSDAHWLIPIIATTKDNGEWFKSTKLNGTIAKDYFPTLSRPKIE